MLVKLTNIIISCGGNFLSIQESAFCYQSQHQPCPVSCRWGLFATLPHCTLHRAQFALVCVDVSICDELYGGSHDGKVSQKYFFFPALLLLLLLLLERQRLFQRRGLVPRHRPAGPLGYVESSKSMSRSEREAGRRPSQLIMTLSNSLPIQ